MVLPKTLCIVVPAHNSAQHLEKCLVAIRNSTTNDYELIVVDDASSDNTHRIAQQYADRVISIPKTSRRLAVRFAGFASSNSPILVNIDSDVVVKPDTLAIILDTFSKNPEIGALTGLLAKDSPHDNFFSRYKHLYMNYIFSMLPTRVTFLYGSIFALSRETFDFAVKNFTPKCASFADDTELGQFLNSKNIPIAFELKLEVSHLKTFNFSQLLRNDFQIPRSFARLLFRFKSKLKISRNSPAYIHSPYSQLLAIVSVYAAILFIPYSTRVALSFLILWIISNCKFCVFVFQATGLVFTIKTILFTLIDQIVMGAGVMKGLLDGLTRNISLKNSQVRVAKQTLIEIESIPIFPIESEVSK